MPRRPTAAPRQPRLRPAALGAASACLLLGAALPCRAQQAPAATASVPATAVVGVAAGAPVVQLQAITVTSGGEQGFRAPPRHAFSVDPDALHQPAADGLANVLAQQLPGMALTHEQGNPMQPSLHFNGFAASPLLGTPQGLSVFLDGVRINEPFGDTVNWDLIPTDAISSAQLVPIADPVFGLNSLGGAVLLHTADGLSALGGEIDVTAGSFGRTSTSMRYGTHWGDWTALVAASNKHDNGFAPFSSSNNRTLLVKTTRRADGNNLDLSYTFAQSRLAGSQTLPQTWLNTPTAIYTAPDIISNLLNFINIGDTQVLAPHWQASARLWLRNSNQTNFNSNVNGDYSGGTPTLSDPVASNALDGLHQQSRGINLALHNDSPLAGMRNSASVGLSLSHQRVDFTQIQQAATFTPDRYTVGIGPFDQAPVALAVRNRDTGLYLTERLSPTHWLDVNAGGRYERVHMDMTDLLGGALGGTHDFSRFNPSVGLDIHPTPHASYYLRYAEAMRVPMPVELTCASPTAPCTLPNVLVADPPLAPVIARSAQTGAVWRLGWLRVHAQFTQTRLSNAIQFISTANMSQGYFTNIPEELFRTATLDLTGGNARWYWSASISHTLATYQSSFQEPSGSNSSADANGNIQVNPGDHLPNIPVWSGKLRVQLQATDRLQLNTVVSAYGPRYAQGDENNLDSHGQVSGFAVVDLGGAYRIDRHWHATLTVHNLFNRVYTNFGQLGVNEFTGANRAFSSNPADWANAMFVAPGAPRGIWLGLRYAWS